MTPMYSACGHEVEFIGDLKFISKPPEQAFRAAGKANKRP
jgi:hypothetical protein